MPTAKDEYGQGLFRGENPSLEGPPRPYGVFLGLIKGKLLKAPPWLHFWAKILPKNVVFLTASEASPKLYACKFTRGNTKLALNFVRPRSGGLCSEANSTENLN